MVKVKAKRQGFTLKKSNNSSNKKLKLKPNDEPWNKKPKTVPSVNNKDKKNAELAIAFERSGQAPYLKTSLNTVTLGASSLEKFMNPIDTSSLVEKFDENLSKDLECLKSSGPPPDNIARNRKVNESVVSTNPFAGLDCDSDNEMEHKITLQPSRLDGQL